MAGQDGRNWIQSLTDGDLEYLATYHQICSQWRTMSGITPSKAGLLADIVNTSDDAIIAKSLDGAILIWNTAAERMYGYSAGEALGRDISLIVPPDYRSESDWIMERIKHGEQIKHHRTVRLRKDGERLDILLTVSPIMDATGGIIGASSIGRDLTDARRSTKARRESEESLRQSEARYKQLLASVTDYIYTVMVSDGQAVFTLHTPGCVNVTGYTAEEFVTDPTLWYQMVHEGDRDAVIRQAANTIVGTTAPLEHRIIHKNGSIRWVRNTPVVHKDEQGHVTSFDGLVSDITERKIAEEALYKVIDELQESQRQLKVSQTLLINAEKMQVIGQLSAGVAHEVKNPLAILLMNVDYLSHIVPDADGRVAEVLKAMRDAVARADTIIHGLLVFAAPEELDLQSQDMNSVVEAALLLFKHNITKNHVTLKGELAPDLPPVAIDRNKIEQVLINLFSNSVDAMPDGGTLSVRTCLERTSDSGEASIVVELKDTGSGIPSDKLSRIYDPFFTTKPVGKGTGLGLTVARKIIDLHGASLEIKNRQKGGVRSILRFRGGGGILAAQTTRDKVPAKIISKKEKSKGGA